MTLEAKFGSIEPVDYPFTKRNSSKTRLLLPAGSYKKVGALEMKKLNKKKIKIAGGKTVKTRDEDPRIDMVHWIAGVVPKSAFPDDMNYPPFQHESWTVTYSDLRGMLKEDIERGEPYTRLFPPSVDLRRKFNEFMTKQISSSVKEGYLAEDWKQKVEKKAPLPCYSVDSNTGFVRLSFNGRTSFEFPRPNLCVTKLDDETLRRVMEPPGKLNYQDVFHQTMKNVQMEEIKKYEAREKRELELELERKKSSALNLPIYQPGVKGTPKVPRFEPQWLIQKRQESAHTSTNSHSQRSGAKDPPYVWPAPPKDDDDSDDDGDVEDDLSDSESELPMKKKKTTKSLMKAIANGVVKTESSSSKHQKTLLLQKIKKNMKKSYKSRLGTTPVRQTAQPRVTKKEQEPKIKPSIASITGAEEQKKLETIKQKIDEKQEKKVTAPLVIVDPKIQKEKMRALESAKKEQERQAKLAAELVKTRGPELPSACVGSLNPERPLNNGELYVAKNSEEANGLYLNGNHGMSNGASSKNYRIPRRQAAIYSMPDLEFAAVEASVVQAPPQGSKDPSIISSQNGLNGIVTVASDDQVDNHVVVPAPTRQKVFIPVASDEDEDDQDVLDLFANVDDDDMFDL